MVKINFNDFLDILSNVKVKGKFADLFDLSSVKQKLDGLQATIDSLHLELIAGKTAINKVIFENHHLRALINDFSARNNLQQEAKRDNLIITGLSLAVAETTGSGLDASSSIRSTKLSTSAMKPWGCLIFWLATFLLPTSCHSLNSCWGIFLLPISW